MSEEAVRSSVNMVLTGYAWWLAIPLAILLGALIVKLYWRETNGFHRSGAILRALRAAVVVILVLLLSQPILHRVSAQFEPPVVVILRDSSSSMSVRDMHEPMERKIRATVALGLLDVKLRDTHAEDAVAALNKAQNSVDSAIAQARQALQQLQESGASAGDVHDRLVEAARSLNSAATDAKNAEKSIGATPGVGADQASQAAKLSETAGALARDLPELPAKAADARNYLNDKSQSLKALKQDLAKLEKAATQLQDRADQALGNGNNPAVKAALGKLEGMDRAAITAEMLKKAQAASGERVRIVTYDIDTDLHSAEAASEKDASIKAPSISTDTDLATPLLRLSERHAEDPISAVVMCTDGRHTTGPAPEDAARAIAARGIALHTLGVGSVEPPADICVARLDGTLSVFLEETIHLTAHVKTNGFKGKKCKLVLKRGDKEIQQRELTIVEDGWIHQDFEITADKSGANSFTASIQPLQGESLTTNNSADALVDVSNDRLKVLLADELPRWETRYVASLLRRERKMNLNERWLMTGEGLGPRAAALPDDQKALDEFDIIVLGDVSTERLDDNAQRRLAKYVADRGGFLIIVAGQKAMPHAYQTGALADLLPIRQQLPAALSASVSSTDIAPRVRIKLNPDGSHNEMIRVLRDPVLNEQLWPALPELQWVSRPSFPKPGATALLQTDDARKDAVIAVQNFGAGRVLYVGTDNTWRWRYKVGDRVHAVFWSQAIRWGTSNRLTGGDRLKAGTDRRQVRPSENVEVLARPRDKDGKPVANAVVIAEIEDKTRQQHVQLQAVPDSGGLYRGTLQNLTAGIHEIKVHVEAPEFQGVEEHLQVVAREVTGQEGVELSRDTARLAAIAASGSGRYADILEAPQLFKDLAGQGKQRTLESSYELWSSYPALLLVVALLAIEWILRKKLGLA